MIWKIHTTWKFVWTLQCYQFSILYITCLEDMHYCGRRSNVKKMRKYMSSRKYDHIYVLPGCLKFASWLLEVCSLVAWGLLCLPYCQCEVPCIWDASWFHLVYSFWNGIGLRKEQNEDKRFLFLNSLILFYFSFMLHSCFNSFTFL